MSLGADAPVYISNKEMPYNNDIDNNNNNNNNDNGYDHDSNNDYDDHYDSESDNDNENNNSEYDDNNENSQDNNELNIKKVEEKATKFPDFAPDDGSALSNVDMIDSSDPIPLKSHHTQHNKENKMSASITDSSEMVIVTAADDSFFQSLTNMIGSIHFWNKDKPIIVYDLGLTTEMREAIGSWCNVELRWPGGVPPTFARHIHIPKIYAWKPLAIKDALKYYSKVLWLDAGNNVRGSLDIIEKYLTQDGHYLVQGQDGDMTRHTHDLTMRFLGQNKEEFTGKPSYA
eukprot:Ihof_evm9s132 gene=Ihof_evmTU9s132